MPFVRDLDGLFCSPHDRPPKWVAMLYAYLDETGQESKEWVYITGFLGSEDHWRKFVPAWEQGFVGSQRKRLHMNELRFKRMSEKRLLERLASIPISCGLEPLIGGVRVNDYEDLFGGDAFLGKLNAGFVTALMPLLVQLARWLPENERVELIFEQQDRYMGLVDFTLKNLIELSGMETKDGFPKIAKWSFVPKGSTSLTEPADFFSYAMSQWKKDQQSTRAQWCKPILESVDTVRAIGAVFEREHVRFFVSNLMEFLKKENIVMPKTNEEFEKFRKLASEVLKVSHDELKTKLDSERAAKERKKEAKVKRNDH